MTNSPAQQMPDDQMRRIQKNAFTHAVGVADDLYSHIRQESYIAGAIDEYATSAKVIQALKEWKDDISGSGDSWGWLDLRRKINSILELCKPQ